MLEADPRIGTEIGGYRIEALLRRSGRAVVYRAHDVRLERTVALELLSAELSADQRFRERFLREWHVSASLDHPSIVPVIQAGEAEGHLYVAMGLVEGADLASLLARSGPLDPGRSLAIVARLAEALDTARWSRGLMHGSLTPSEVLVASAVDTDSREQVFLFGFGLRRELPAGAGLGDAARRLGTIDYLAPEQIEGTSVSPRTDVYALGCVLFECLTGGPPFKRDSPEAVLEAHLHTQPPAATRSCPGLPTLIDRVIAKALSKWPEERYSTCAELATAAQAALAPGEQPERAPDDERLSPTALPPHALGAPDGASVVEPDSLAQGVRRRPRRAIAAIGLAVLPAALVAGVFLLTGGDTGGNETAAPASPGLGAAGEVAALAGQANAEPPARTEPPRAPAAEPVGDGSLGSGSLVRIDARSGEILARVAMPHPHALASSGGSIWALGREDPGESLLLVRVEPATNAVTEIFDGGVSATLPPWLAAAGGSAWVVDESGAVHRFAPGASRAEPVELEANGARFHSAFSAGGSLWASSGGSPPVLLRIDPATGRVLERILGVDDVVAAGPGFVWAVWFQWPVYPKDVGPGIVRIDTETHATTPIGALEFPWGEFTVARGAVWASSPDDGTIVRLDPVTGEENQRIRVGRAPVALAAGAGAVWAAIPDDGAVVRYDLATGRTETIDLGGTPRDLVFARGSVWAAVEIVS